MADTDNLVPDDDVKVDKPDAIVTIEEIKPDAKGDAVVKTDEVRVVERDAVDEGVEALTRNLEKAKKEKAVAENRANTEANARKQAEQRAFKAESRISQEVQLNIEANRTAATNDLSAAKAELEKAESDYIALQSEGKFKEAFDATKRGAKAQQRLDYAEAYINKLDATVAEMEANPQPEKQQPVDDGGKVDAVTGIKFTPKTSEWVEKQGEKWKDADFRMECDAAARGAKRQGLKPDTDEYFEFVEKRLQREGYLDAPEESEAEEEVVEEQPKPQVKTVVKKPQGGSVSAAPSRAVQGTSGVAKKGIKVTGGQRDATAAILESLPEWFPNANADKVAAQSIKEAADKGEQWAIDQMNNR